jgi:NAD(P)-dependent dehydrogenase (short-subunit alcohol dehydrogenase family)
VCANAGTAGPTNRIEDVDPAEWKTCVSVNLEGAFLAAKYAAPLMKNQGNGSLIFTSSTAGIYGYPNRAPYAAAKWGIIGLMKTVAMELGPFGIRANAICPGAVEGPRMEGVLQREAKAKGMTRDQVYEGYAKRTSMRSFVTAQDIASMAVFLGSDAAKMVSGQVIAVDGHTENPDPKL